MVYRKFAADHLFTGRVMLGSDFILLTDEKGLIMDIVHETAAGEGIERYTGVLTPGFINCHCHLELSHFQGKIPEHTGMIPFILSVINNRNTWPQDIPVAIAKAEDSMIESGIVAVGDICNTADTIPQKQLGNLYYHSFVEVFSFNEALAGIRFAEGEELLGKFANTPLLHRAVEDAPDQQHIPERKSLMASIVPHAPYSVSPALFALIENHQPGTVISMHNQESPEENEYFLRGTGGFAELFRQLGTDASGFTAPGKSSLLSSIDRFHPARRLILVHNVHTSAEDLYYACTRTSLYWCLCPNANLYITGKLPDIGLLSRHTTKIVVGTDSLASNWQLNILEELKVIQKHHPVIPAEELLTWATLNGAEALMIDDIFGSFEKGKRPGVVLVEGIENNTITPHSTSCRLL